MSGLNILPADEENIKEAAKIAGENLGDEAWSEQVYLNQLSVKNSYTFLAEYNGRFAGVLNLYLVGEEGQINNLAVDENYRRKGIAQSLLEYAQEKVYAKKWVLEVRSKNIAAVKLYEKNGFVKAGLRKNFYTSPNDDGVIMVK